MIFYFQWSYKKLCYFELWPQNTFGQSNFRIFYFWLVWLVNLNTGSPLLHCTCFDERGRCPTIWRSLYFTIWERSKHFIQRKWFPKRGPTVVVFIANGLQGNILCRKILNLFRLTLVSCPLCHVVYTANVLLILCFVTINSSALEQESHTMRVYLFIYDLYLMVKQIQQKQYTVSSVYFDNVMSICTRNEICS